MAEALAEVRAAVSFLTRLPVVGSAVDVDRTGAAAFALVGAGIGLVAAIPVVILGSRLPLPAAVLALLLIVMVSGGLHLDGLGDTADALAAPTPEAAETARTDPRAGAAGVAAIALDLLLGVSLLAAVTAADPRIAAAALVVAVTASRAAAPLAARLWRVGRAGDESGGLGGWFATRVGSADVVGAVAMTAMVTAIAAIVAGAGAWAMWLGAAGGAVAAAAIAAFIVGRRGTLDGDGYGAIVEVTFGCILGGAAFGVSAT